MEHLAQYRAPPPLIAVAEQAVHDDVGAPDTALSETLAGVVSRRVLGTAHQYIERCAARASTPPVVCTESFVSVHSTLHATRSLASWVIDVVKAWVSRRVGV